MLKESYVDYPTGSEIRSCILFLKLSRSVIYESISSILDISQY